MKRFTPPPNLWVVFAVGELGQDKRDIAYFSTHHDEILKYKRMMEGWHNNRGTKLYIAKYTRLIGRDGFRLHERRKPKRSNS